MNSIFSTPRTTLTGNSGYPTNNQMFGYAYDAAGDLLSDGLNAMTWDSEGRMASLGGVTYSYDPLGNRVGKHFGGRPIARLNGGQWTDLIYGPTGVIAEVPGTQNGAPMYQVVDHLGTTVGNLLADGTFVDPLDYTPFGRVFSGSTSDPYLFTGKERDAESGLDYFGARYYASSMGRWMSPDWASHPQAVPYASLGNPQSLNLYAYVNNNPLSQVDADGHFASPWHFLLTFVAAIATGHDPVHAAILAGKNVMVDFRKGSQSGDPSATHVHAMAAEGETTAQAYAGTAQTVSQEESSGDTAGAQHTIQDSYASGHDYSVWAPQDGAFGGLGFWGTVKHEFGDWLPSPGALWGALKGSIDELRDPGGNPDTTLHPTPPSPGGGANPGGMPNCIGCITPPGYTPPAPQPMPINKDPVHTVSQ